MSMPWRARVLSLVLLVVVLGRAADSLGRQPTPPLKDAEPAVTPEPVALATDPLVRRKLDAAGDYIKVRSWAEAVRLLQGLLDSREDAFLPPRATAGRARVQRWASVHAEAERLIAALPPAGKDYYRLNYDGIADRLLQEARRRADRAALHDLTRRFRYTRAGAEALAMLGGYYLDRGQAGLAAGCFRRLLDSPPPEAVSAATLFLAAAAFRGAGDGQREQAAWAELERRLAGEPLRLSGHDLGLDDLRRQVDHLGSGAALVKGEEQDWPTYRGDARRCAVAQGGPFLLQTALRIPTAAGEAGEWIRRTLRTSSPGVLPGAVPVAVEGRIVLRTPLGIQAVDAHSGREVWRTAAPLGLDALLEDPGRKVQLRHWFDLYNQDRGVLLANSTLGTLSSDTRHVYAIEDLVLPPHPILLQQQQQGEVRSLGPMRYFTGHNRLRALDLADGHVVWEVGGPAPMAAVPKPVPRPDKSPAARAARAAPRLARQDSLTDACFLGPPLPLGDDLLVVIDKQEDVQLACLDGHSGLVRWTQPLAAAAQKMLLDVDRHTHAIHLAYADGVLVCPTGCGAVVGVDPLSRRLLWAHVYREPGPGTPGDDDPSGNGRPLQTNWTGCAPIIHGGRVVLSAPDADNILCLGLAEGGLLWKTPRSDEDLYVAGVFGTQVLIIGKSACRAVSLSSGETLWQRATGMPAGQGIAAADTYYLPLADGAVLALDLKKPPAAARIEPRSPNASLGNLLFYDGVLWSQGPEALVAFTPVQNRLREVEARLARAAADGAALAERGRLRLERGDLRGGIADLHEALAGSLSAQTQGATRTRLFGALIELLQRDFPQAEKHLADCETLCMLAPGKDGRPPSAEEVRQRRQQLFALVAAGRGRQGQVPWALQSWRNLLALSRPGDLLPMPEDPALRVRPEVWVRERVAELARATDTDGRQALAAEMDRAWRSVRDHKDDAEALDRYLTLFGSVPPVRGAAVRGAWARLLLAQQLAELPDARHSLEADLLCAALAEDPAPAARALVAEALEVQAGLLLRRGRLDEAAVVYHRLGTQFPGWDLPTGTGAEILSRARLDKRLLPYLAAVERPQRPAWVPGRIAAVERPASPPTDQILLPCVPRLPAPPASPGTLGPAEGLPVGGDLRFFLDGRALSLVATERDTGRRLWAVPLPLQSLPPALRNSELPAQVVDHLLLVGFGQKLFAIDLLQRRVRWVHDFIEGINPTQVVSAMMSDGAVQTFSPDGQTVRRLGWVGPASRRGIFVMNSNGLNCLDVATGQPRWVRSDLPAWLLSVFGDDAHLFLGEHYPNGNPRGLRAVSLADGRLIPIRDASTAYAKRLRVLGRRLLVGAEGPAGEVALRLYDPLTGKDDWARTFPAGSLVLSAPTPELLGVASPDGAVTEVDLSTGREGPRLTLEPVHRPAARVTGGCLFRDAEQIYVGLLGQGEGSATLMAGPNPYFAGGLASLSINGMLYAFDRATGKRRWYSQAPGLGILLERFDELPVLLGAAVSNRQTDPPGNAEVVLAVRSFDKRTGKILFNREYRTTGETFHSLRLDRHAGTVDLLSGTLVLRHQPVRGR
jgi:outer membrane protein assembly factor BamB